MLVYREGGRRVHTRTLLAELGRDVDALCASSSRSALSALLRAADLECALADAGVDAPECAALTSALAERWLSGDASEPPIDVRALFAREVPESLVLGRPEGYAYYGLHPRLYAELAAECRLGASEAAVVGVRSIGTSLSAVVRAALRRRGIAAERLTVRPTGHPWTRSLQLSPAECRFIETHREAHFLVVDEGPGLSGSTLLAVGEALASRGVPARRITFLCGHEVARPEALLAPDAAARWARFRALAVTRLEPPEGARDFSAGAWRARTHGTSSSWPGAWISRERLKFWFEDRAELWKFEGLPPYDDAVRRRAELMFESGFGPALREAEPGFLAYRWHTGVSGAAERVDTALVRRLARYVAFRERAFRAEIDEAQPLAEMARLNVEEALGLALPARFELPLERVVIPDGRMAPHEWVTSPGAEPLKVDGVDHGDDHLFPGPTDVAWDLAGAIVEWQLDDQARAALLEAYARESGDDVRSRLDAYVIAYCAFQLGCLAFAVHDSDTGEQARLERARPRYESAIRRALGSCTAAL